MLQARLAQVARDLDAVQSSLVQERRATSRPNAATRVRPEALLWAPQSVRIPTALFESADINVAVAGVEVGKVFPWLQRRLTRSRTLTFSVYFQEGKAVVVGDVSALTWRGQSVSFEAPPAPDQIANRMALALIRQKLSGDTTSTIGALDLDEFERLIGVVMDAEALNRRARYGRHVHGAFSILLPRVEALLDKVPAWRELGLFAADIAYNGRNTAAALRLYREIAEAAKGDTTLRRLAQRAHVGERLEELRRTADDASPGLERTDTAARTFVEGVARAHRKFALPEPVPAVAVVQPAAGEAVVTTWNGDLQRTEVDPRHLDDPGLAHYVALMGHFMRQHYASCVGSGGDRPQRDWRTWNDVRMGASAFLLGEELEEGDGTYGRDTRVFAALHRLQRVQREDGATRRLALAILDGYECDWTQGTLTGEVTAIGAELQLFTEAVTRGAFGGP